MTTQSKKEKEDRCVVDKVRKEKQVTEKGQEEGQMTEKERYRRVLNGFADKVNRDPNVIALILSGSLAHGTVWEKSDLDLTLLVRDGSIKEYVEYCVEEEEIEIHLIVEETKTYKQEMRRYRAGAFAHSFYGKSEFVFTKDPALHTIFEETRAVGLEDAILSCYQKLQFMLGNMDKAEKWVTVFHDPLYAQHFLQWCAVTCAEIVVLLHGQDPDREALLLASELEPELMDKVYARPCSQAMTEEEVRETLATLRNFIHENTEVLSKPILRFLSDGEMRTASECTNYFDNQSMVTYLKFLATEEGILGMGTKPSRVFKHSALEVEEISFWLLQS